MLAKKRLKIEEKKALVAGICEKIKKSSVGVVVDYSGISEEDTKLRRELRENGVSYKVIKNTLFERAIEIMGLEMQADVLSGSTALALSENNYTAAPKILYNFSKKYNFFKIKSGFIDGKVVSAKEVETLAMLPPREVLIAQVLGGLNSPIGSFVNVLAATMKNFLYVLDQISKKRACVKHNL